MKTVKLDFPDKDLYILADGDWRGFRSRPCQKEPETVEWIRSFEEGSVLWDVGASVGPYSLIAAALKHHVVAFEPFYPSLGHLQQNIWLNHMDNDIWVNSFALYNRAGMGRLHVSATEPGSASHGKGIFHQEIGFTTVDDAAYVYEDKPLRSPTHVKIDVDGGELAVIKGGRNTWKHVKSIMVESEPPTVDDITVILNDAGLTLVDSWKRLGDTKQKNYLYRRI